jgi:fructokinase
MIICCGEALIDFMPAQSGTAYRPCPGGSIMNIAVGLGRMQIPVGFLSRLSTDLFGDMLADHLISNQVNLTYCPRTPGQTTLAFVSLDEGDSQEPQYAFYADGAVDREMTKDDLPAAIGDEVKALHFGSISLVLEPGASALEALMQRESRNRILSLDPNVRPIVIDDWDAYRKRFEGWLTCIDILRLSQADLTHLYPDAQISSLLNEWFEAGVSLVILTKGAEGASAYTKSGVDAFVPTQKVKVRDTVGAGDTFFSAVLTYLYENHLLENCDVIAEMDLKQLQGCLAFATEAAAINCTREGANPPYRHEMSV